MENKCVYRHRRIDTGEVFYVGMGNPNRPKSYFTRSKHWHYIVNKVGYNIEVIVSNLNEEDALELEELLILEYGRQDINTGQLCNHTSGGKGLISLSKESILKRTRKLTGRKASKEARKNMSEGSKGKNNGRSKKVICTITDKIWNCARECAEENKINYNTFRQWLNGTKRNKSPYKYMNYAY